MSADKNDFLTELIQPVDNFTKSCIYKKSIDSFYLYLLEKCQEKVLKNVFYDTVNTGKCKKYMFHSNGCWNYRFLLDRSVSKTVANALK